MKHLLTTLCLCFSYYISFAQLPTQVTIDSSFGTNGTTRLASVLASNYGLIVLPNDKIIILGSDSTTFFPQLLMMDQQGHLDKSFGTRGGRTIDSISAYFGLYYFQNKIVVFKRFAQVVGQTISRYLQDGSPDRSFNDSGYVNVPISGEYPALLATQSNEKYILLGYDSTRKYLVMLRYNNDGTPDPSFCNCDMGIHDTSRSSYIGISAVAVQADNKILASGVNGDYGKPFLLRYNADGTPDKSFMVNDSVSYISNGYISSIHKLQSGKILSSGYVSNNTGFYHFISRLNTDGSIDKTFGNNGICYISLPYALVLPTSGVSHNIAIQTNGDIVLGITNYNYAGYGPSVSSFVVKCSENGVLDTTWVDKGILYVYNGYESVAINGLGLQLNDDIIVTGLSYSGLFVCRYITHDNAANVPAPYIVAYPTPSAGKITLYPANFSGTASISACDIRGKTMFTRLCSFSAFTGTEIDISTYPSAVYMLNIVYTDGKKQTIKLLKN